MDESPPHRVEWDRHCDCQYCDDGIEFAGIENTPERPEKMEEDHQTEEENTEETEDLQELLELCLEFLHNQRLGRDIVLDQSCIEMFLPTVIT